MSQPGRRTMVADEPLAPRTPGALRWALRAVDSGPRAFGRAALASLAATSVLLMAIALSVRPRGLLPQPQRELLLAGLAGLALATVLVLAPAFRPAGERTSVLDRVAAPDQRAAIWLALACWFPALLVAAYFRARSAFAPSVHWIAFGYLDKRWVTAGYLICALLPMLLLVAAARVLAVGRQHPAGWRAWLVALGRPGIAEAPGGLHGVTATEPAEAAPGVRSRSPQAALASVLGSRYVRIAAGILTAVAVAWYFYGPPWYLGKATGQVGIADQEDVFLSGLQAISKGNLPYLGPAAVQYGPGTQLLSYLYMRHIGTFSVIGFRESWAMLEWAGASLFFVVLFLAFGYARGLAASLLSALVYPALQQMGFVSGGVYTGYFGWANPLRYAGAISLILLLPAVIRRCPARRGLLGAAVLGVLWGFMSYVAQENLIAGAVGALAVAALLLLSGTSSWRPVLTGLLATFAGFVLAWVPVLAFYAAHGVLRRFVYLYFLIPRAVAEGYSNTPFGGVKPGPVQDAISDPWKLLFDLTPVILAILALLCIVQLRPFRIAGQWTRERIMVVAVVLTTILMYQGALLRSDASHLTGTLLIVPGLVVVVASVLPRLLGAVSRVTLVGAGAVIVVAALLLLPYKSFAPSSVGGRLTAPYQDRQRLAADPKPGTATSVAALRAGAALAAAPECCLGTRPVAMSSFLTLMNRVHGIVGSRTAYVVSFRGEYPGLVYFSADLTPAPVSLDLATMVMTEPQLRQYLATFRTYVVPRTQALLTESLHAPQARYFLHRYAQARIIKLTYAGRPYYVVLSTG